MAPLSFPVGLDASIQILATCLAQTNDNYQRLLNQPESLPFCKEAGRSLRVLSDRYAQVLQAALSCPPEFDEDDEFLDDDEESFVEEDNDD